MPVQENEQKKPTDQYIPENKKEVIIPLLSAVYEKYIDRADSIEKKIIVRQEKIARNQAKIENLTAKADRLEATNAILKNFAGKIGAVSAIISANEKRINTIRNEKIPQKEQKIEFHREKIRIYSHKKEVTICKAEKIASLSAAVKSLSVSNKSERRIQFSESMDRLNAALKQSLAYKLEKQQNKLDIMKHQYTRTDSSLEKYELSQSISNVQKKLNAINERIENLNNIRVPFRDRDENTIDMAVKAVDRKIEQTEKPDFSNWIDEMVHTADHPEKSTESEKTETVKSEKDKKSLKKINPEFYKNLPKSERKIETFENNIALKLMDNLKQKGIEFSAVSRESNSFAITVEKKNEALLKDIFKSTVKDNYHKTQPEKAAFFSRKSMHKEAEEISRHEHKEGSQNKNRANALG